MATYEIMPERATLHGAFSRDRKPCLSIASGDTVRFQTLEAGWSIVPRQTGDPNEAITRFEPREEFADKGHALCGPVFIEGAEPDMTLEVQIGEVRPAAWGYVYAGGWNTPLNDRLGVAEGSGTVHVWALDWDTMTGRNQHGHEVSLRPFMGVMGMPENVPGLQSTTPPRVTGGNLDCKELVAGSSLFLPVAVSGGLFSVGDGHATQADGEVSGLAIECPMKQVDLTFRLHPALSLTTPRANTPAGWITLGLDEDLDKAMQIALDAMLGLMGELYGLEKRDALALASLVVDLRITQVVNGVQGVHALLPHGALKMPA